MMKIDIITLLENKDFKELTQNERAAVLKEMTEAEYVEQRKLIFIVPEIAQSEKNKLIPDPQVLLIAKQRLQENSSLRKRSGLVIVFQHKIPTWVASVACVFLLFGFWGFQKSSSEKTTTVVTETVNDTVYQEKIVTEQIELPADTIVNYVYINQPEKVNEVVHSSNSFTIEEPSYSNLLFREDEYCNIMSCYEPKKGVPVVNDTLLALIHGDM